MVANKLNVSCFVPLGGPWPVEVAKLKERAQELQEVGSLCDEEGACSGFLEKITEKRHW